MPKMRKVTDLTDCIKFAGDNADTGQTTDCVETAPKRKSGREGHMTESHSLQPQRRELRLGLVLMIACASSTGCLGPQAVRQTRLRYNEVYRSTNDEQLLMNVVRLRYADSPVFIDLPNITGQFEVNGQGNYTGGNGNQFPGRTHLGFGQLGLRDTPTLSYHPREGREIAKALLTPLSADLFIAVNAGATTEQLLFMALNDINDVPNAPRATTMVPRFADDNSTFRRGLRLVSELQHRDALELSIGTTEEREDSSDPIPVAQVQGRDLLNAAKDGYVYRASGKGQLTLVKREKGLVLKVRPQFVHSPEMAEYARIFRLTPGLDRYRIKSELADEANARLPRPIQDTLYLNMRSVLQIMVFLSKGVCVPTEHVVGGVVPMTPGPDGQLYDWTRVTAGQFCVAAQKHRPHDAEVAVQYRGYWFFIPRNDVNSRAILAILETLFDLQETGERPGGPLLTLPISG
jgi:hypothetical protein